MGREVIAAPLRHLFFKVAQGGARVTQSDPPRGVCGTCATTPYRGVEVAQVAQLTDCGAFAAKVARCR